jgi:hypothetical protein
MPWAQMLTCACHAHGRAYRASALLHVTPGGHRSCQIVSKIVSNVVASGQLQLPVEQSMARVLHAAPRLRWTAAMLWLDFARS